MTDFSVSNAHTIIGAAWFHGRVRDGIEWFPRAQVARRKGGGGALRRVQLQHNEATRYLGAGPQDLGVRGSSRTVD